MYFTVFWTFSVFMYIGTACYALNNEVETFESQIKGK